MELLSDLFSDLLCRCQVGEAAVPFARGHLPGGDEVHRVFFSGLPLNGVHQGVGVVYLDEVLDEGGNFSWIGILVVDGLDVDDTLAPSTCSSGSALLVNHSLF